MGKKDEKYKNNANDSAHDFVKERTTTTAHDHESNHLNHLFLEKAIDK